MAIQISEISGDGSLSGLGITTQERIDQMNAAASAGAKKVTGSVVRAAQPLRLARGSDGQPIVIRPDATAPLHPADVAAGKTVDESGNILDANGTVLVDSNNNVTPAGQMTIDSGGSGGSGGSSVSYGEQQGGFFANLMNTVKANPLLFALGATALVAAMIFVPKLLKGMKMPGMSPGPVEAMGLGTVQKPKKKRKSKKKSVTALIDSYVDKREKWVDAQPDQAEALDHWIATHFKEERLLQKRLNAEKKQD